MLSPGVGYIARVQIPHRLLSASKRHRLRVLDSFVSGSAKGVYSLFRCFFNEICSCKA